MVSEEQSKKIPGREKKLISWCHFLLSYCKTCSLQHRAYKEIAYKSLEEAEYSNNADYSTVAGLFLW